MKFLEIFLINVISVIIKCQNFCDKQHKNQLIDGLFNVDTTVYAFRNTNVWIINDLTNIANTDITPIPFTQLITGITIDSIRSGFSITGFASSDTFNPNGITFLFDGNKYYVSKYRNETQFDAISDSDKQNIPWNAKTTGIMKNVLIIESSINAAVYDDINNIVYLVTDNSVDIFPLTENRAEPTNIDEQLGQQFVDGNGGIMANDNVMFFAQNNVWTYNDEGFRSLNQTYWQYFQCERILSDNGYVKRRRKQIKTLEEFQNFRKSLLLMMIVLFILVQIVALMITIVVYILFKNSEPNKLSDGFGETEQTVVIDANESPNKDIYAYDQSKSNV